MHFAKPSCLIGALFLAALLGMTTLVAPAASAQAADTLRTVVSGGIKREYILHMPRGAPAGPKPLVIALHGALQPAGMMQRYLDLDAVADREGFVVAYPKGLNLLWNDGRSSIAGFIPLLQKRDDGRFVVDLLDKLAADGIADPSRAYLMGFSNGGFLTAFVACRYADRFAAFATMMMTVPVGYSESCRPAKPVPILLMNGTYDPIVPMFGRPTPGARLMSANATAALFARLDGCSAPEQTSAPHARITRWNRCAPGGAVAYYEIAGGHQPPSQSTGAVDALASVLLGPRRSGLDAPQEIWAFFERFGGGAPPPEPQIASADAPGTALALAAVPLPPARPPIPNTADSLATAWQGIVPAQDHLQAPGAATSASGSLTVPVHEAQAAAIPAAIPPATPALHRPIVAGATMPLAPYFVPADTLAVSMTATAALVPLPPPSPLRRRAASAR